MDAYDSGCFSPQSQRAIGVGCKVTLDIDCKQRAKQEQEHGSVCMKIFNELTHEVEHPLDWHPIS